jgi:hypothetical protein
MTPPRRRYTVIIRVSGDTPEDVGRELDELARHIPDHLPQCNSVGGGCSSGHIVEVIEDPTMTREKYFTALEAFLGAREVKARIGGDRSTDGDGDCG